MKGITLMEKGCVDIVRDSYCDSQREVNTLFPKHDLDLGLLNPDSTTTLLKNKKQNLIDLFFLF